MTLRKALSPSKRFSLQPMAWSASRTGIRLLARIPLLLLFLLLLPAWEIGETLRAQNSLKELWTKVDNILAERYYHTSYDTNYVVRPEGKVTLKLKVNQTGNSIHAKRMDNDTEWKAHLRTSHKTTISIGAAYRGLSVSYSINPAKLGGSYKDDEWNFNYYGSRLSLDASYQRSSSMSGHIEHDAGKINVVRGDVTMKVFNLTGYYCFNHRHFSFSSAFNQSYVQRRSAGSWLAGMSYQGGSLRTTDKLTVRYPNAPDVTLKARHLAIGGGYGYNLVRGGKWLFHLSLLPTFVVFNRNNLTIDTDSRGAGPMRFNMIFNERVAVNYNISSRWFAGSTLVMSNSLFDDRMVVANQNKWIARTFIGMRL